MGGGVGGGGLLVWDLWAQRPSLQLRTSRVEEASKVYSLQQDKMKPHLNVHTCLLVFLLLWIVGVAIGVRPSVPCCTKTSDIKIHLNRISAYGLQERPLCPIKAVRFYTQNNSTICSDPTSDWAKRAMRVVDRRTTRVSEDVENRSTTLPLTITLSESPVTGISPGLKTKDTTKEPITLKTVKSSVEKESGSMTVDGRWPDSPASSERPATDERLVTRGTQHLDQEVSGEEEGEGAGRNGRTTAEEKHKTFPVKTGQSPNVETVFCLRRTSTLTANSYLCMHDSL